MQNPDLLRFYGIAKQNELYPPDAYVLKNVQEFFAVTGSLYLWGNVDRPPNDRATLRWSDDSQSGEFGPQGAALILELQRLRHAIDAELNEGRKPRGKPQRGAKPDARRRPGPPKKRRLNSDNIETVYLIGQCVCYLDLERIGKPIPFRREVASIRCT